MGQMTDHDDALNELARLAGETPISDDRLEPLLKRVRAAFPPPLQLQEFDTCPYRVVHRLPECACATPCPLPASPEAKKYVEGYRVGYVDAIDEASKRLDQRVSYCDEGPRLDEAIHCHAAVANMKDDLPTELKANVFHHWDTVRDQYPAHNDDRSCAHRLIVRASGNCASCGTCLEQWKPAVVEVPKFGPCSCRHNAACPLHDYCPCGQEADSYNAFGPGTGPLCKDCHIKRSCPDEAAQCGQIYTGRGDDDTSVCTLPKGHDPSWEHEQRCTGGEIIAMWTSSVVSTRTTEASADERIPAGCVIEHVVSRMCERGTKSCIISHDEKRSGEATTIDWKERHLHAVRERNSYHERCVAAENRVLELERHILKCQEMSDAGVFHGKIVEHILTIYVGEAMKDRLEQQRLDKATTYTRETWPWYGTCAECPHDPGTLYVNQRPWECVNRERGDHRLGSGRRSTLPGSDSDPERCACGVCSACMGAPPIADEPRSDTACVYGCPWRAYACASCLEKMCNEDWDAAIEKCIGEVDCEQVFSAPDLERLKRRLQALKRATRSETAIVSAPDKQGAWRVGRSLARTLYIDDSYVGIMDDPALAQRIVDMMNTLVPVTEAAKMRCTWCGREGTASARAPAFPEKPIPWGWTWTVDPQTLGDAVVCAPCTYNIDLETHRCATLAARREHYATYDSKLLARLVVSLEEALHERKRHVPGVRPPITHVACSVAGVVWSLPKPYRHDSVLRLIGEMSPVKYNDADEHSQGFLDEDGRYLTRDQAWVNADLNGQIKNGRIIGGCLTSEDLW